LVFFVIKVSLVYLISTIQRRYFIKYCLLALVFLLIYLILALILLNLYNLFQFYQVFDICFHFLISFFIYFRIIFIRKELYSQLIIYILIKKFTDDLRGKVIATRILNKLKFSLIKNGNAYMLITHSRKLDGLLNESSFSFTINISSLCLVLYVCLEVNFFLSHQIKFN